MENKLRILFVHNFYQNRGGEDESTEQEIRLMEKKGHDVRLYSRKNEEIESYSIFNKGKLIFEPTWSSRTFREISLLLQDYQPDIVHVQNFFPLISPSVFYACSENNIPAVFTLRNYRLLCPIGIFFRDGEICEECFVHSLWRSIKYACYHKSRVQTSAVAIALKSHRFLHTWDRKVDLFIALSEFTRKKFISTGIPEDKIHVRPNFLETDPGMGDLHREYALYAGRLSREKGVYELVSEWKNIPHIPLLVVGDGPLRKDIETFILENNIQNVKLIGFIPLEQLLSVMKKALFLVMPTLWYETFGRTVIEAYATGTPVVASNIGVVASLVKDGITGTTFDPKEPMDLVKKINYAMEEPKRLRGWSREARSVYEQFYSSSSAYEGIMKIYRVVITNRSK
jgi:glycosyltransferase involved in cell wall biosynthesis